MIQHSTSSSGAPVVKDIGLFNRVRGLLLRGERGKKNVKNSPRFKIVVLLLELKSRRFELMRLEFNPRNALVCHVVSHFSNPATESEFGKQTYQGICGHDGNEMPMNALIAQFCKPNQCFVAVPSGVTAQECAQLALPILTNPTVLDLLQPNGIDVSAWIDCRNRRSQ